MVNPPHRAPSRSRAFLLGWWMLVSLLFLPPATALAADLLHGHDRLEISLHRAVNDIRAKHRLAPLRRNPNLDAVARTHSRDLARQGTLSHQDAEGLDTVLRVVRSGFREFWMAAENLGWTQYPDPSRAMLRGWLRSGPHRDNLLLADADLTGVGVARASDGSVYFTQIYLAQGDEVTPREVSVPCSSPLPAERDPG